MNFFRAFWALAFFTCHPPSGWGETKYALAEPAFDSFFSAVFFEAAGFAAAVFFLSLEASGLAVFLASDAFFLVPALAAASSALSFLEVGIFRHGCVLR